MALRGFPGLGPRAQLDLRHASPRLHDPAAGSGALVGAQSGRQPRRRPSDSAGPRIHFRALRPVVGQLDGAGPAMRLRRLVSWLESSGRSTPAAVFRLTIPRQGHDGPPKRVARRAERGSRHGMRTVTAGATKGMSAVRTVVLAATAIASMAHVGSPDTFFTGEAGPYPLHVSVRLPGVIPGLAQIAVRIPGVPPDPATRVTVQAIQWNVGPDGAPPPDIAERVPGDTELFAADLWFMAPTSYRVHVVVDGQIGRASCREGGYTARAGVRM